MAAYFRGPIWEKEYPCFSIDPSKKDIVNGGKIILPESSFEQLNYRDVEYPLTFRLHHLASNETTHCGVHEFTAPRRRVLLPKWMMRKLQLEEGQQVKVTYIAPLPVATFAKFLPLSTVFLSISDPKTVLEDTLKYFSCLTVGDTIHIEFDGKQCELKVVETTPGPAVNISFCDLKVDFEPPVGYVEPRSPDELDEEQETNLVDGHFVDSFRAFGCQGYRCDDRIEDVQPVAQDPALRRRGIPNFDYRKDTITFRRAPRTPPPAKRDGPAGSA